jgi:putative transposase
MARLTRLALAGHLHHVALRGHSGSAVFRDDADRRSFLECLRQAAAEQGVAVHAYCLLDSEVQLLATPPRDEALGRTMQSLGRRYVGAFNRRHRRSGTLWEGRFRSSVLEPQAWLLPSTVYVETLVAFPAEWPWASAPAHLGTCRDPLLTDHPLYWDIGNTPFDRERAHADLLSKGVDSVRAGKLEQALRRGLALGSERFLSELAQRTGRPLQPGRRGRPAAGTSVPNLRHRSVSAPVKRD